jgi:hypothetical protein
LERLFNIQPNYSLMINELLIDHYNNNLRVFNLNLEGVSHEESLKSTHNDSSCLNWIAGHLTVTRDSIISLLGKEKLCSPEMTEKYKRGSAILERETAMSFDGLCKMFRDSQQVLIDAIAAYDFSSEFEKAKRVQFLAFHEAYHCGQLGLLRRFVGKEGAIK